MFDEEKIESIKEEKETPTPPVQETNPIAEPPQLEMEGDTTDDPEKKGKAKKAKPKKEKPTLAVRPPLFGKYEITGITMKDKGLERYMNMILITIPHSSGRYGNTQFGKSKMCIIERLINGMMRTEKYTGKKSKSYKVVSQAFELVNQRTKQNPVQVFIDALQNAAPREEITRLKFGGISVPKAVDVSPSRRLDLALRHICTGSLSSSYRNKKSIQECLANELILASKGDMNSFSISKKEEMERVASSAR